MSLAATPFARLTSRLVCLKPIVSSIPNPDSPTGWPMVAAASPKTRVICR